MISRNIHGLPLSVRFRHEAEYQSDQTVYYLRTREMPYGESLGLIWERYYLDDATQLKTKNGGYIVTLGQYDTERMISPLSAVILIGLCQPRPTTARTFSG